MVVGKKVHSIGGGVLMACLDDTVSELDVEALGWGIVEWYKTQAPVGEVTCVFRDNAFVNDLAKVNLAEILHQQGISRVRSI